VIQVGTPSGCEALKESEPSDPVSKNEKVLVRVHTAALMWATIIAKENRRHRYHSFQESKEQAMLKPSENASRISPSEMQQSVRSPR
jgi:hypothetical protein